MLLLAGPGKAMFGVFAIFVPVLITVFAIVVAAIFGWRLWFGVDKDEPPEKPPSPRRPSNDNKRH